MRKLIKMPSDYGKLQYAVMSLPDLTIQSKAIYALLVSYKKNKINPSFDTIGTDLSLSKTKVTKYINELENKGLIKKSKLDTDSKSKTHNKYDIMIIDEKTKEEDKDGSNQIN